MQAEVDVIPIESALPGARELVSRFLQPIPHTARVVVFCHFDADGLAAGALFGRGLPRLGFSHVEVVPSLRGESAFSDEARARLAARKPEALIVTDLGVQHFGVLPGIPTLLVDHHRPEGEPAGAVVVSGYGWDPIPASAWLAYELLTPLTEMQDLSWIAAVGTLSDLGDKAPWPELAGIKRRFTAKWLKEAVALINSARRASVFDVETPLRLLLEVEHPRAVSEAEEMGAGRLHAYRAEVAAELSKARRQAPLFSATLPLALIKLNSRCQIHPLIAQQWRGRLKEFGVIAANPGYLAGVVAFSARTARADLSLPELFQSVGLGDFGGRFGKGHDQASGGHLPPWAFNQLMDALGFPPAAHVSTEAP